jgi:hypothetical protein
MRLLNLTKAYNLSYYRYKKPTIVGTKTSELLYIYFFAYFFPFFLTD